MLQTAVAAAAGLALAACASPAPVTVNPTYVPPVNRDSKAVAGPRCKVAVTELTDVRRSPEILGVVSGKAVKGPDDRAAWLRSMVDGLGDRGFDLAHGVDPTARVTAQVRLQTAWVDAIRANKNANIVLHVSAVGGGSAIDRDYRGSLANINWVSGDGELRGLVDRAIGKALDQVAVDLAKLCAGGA